MKYKGKKLRHELKYAINSMEYTYLRSKLKTMMESDMNVNGQGEYHISSLYFDDIVNSSYNDKEDGVYQRKKYRIRIYNGSSNIIKLELKEKFNSFITKQSVEISLKLYEEILKDNMNIENFKDNPFLFDFYIETKINGLKPSVIVEYIREPYISKFENVRITFDKELKVIINTSDIFHESPVSVSPKLAGDMILEVKYDDHIPEHIRNLLLLARNQRLAISKYTICREMKNELNWGERII